MNDVLKFLSGKSSKSDFSLQSGSSSRTRPNTYESRKAEILAKNKSLKRLRDKLSPEDLAEIEARERPFFDSLIEKSQDKPYEFSFKNILDPFSFVSGKDKQDQTESKLSKTAFSLTNDTYAGPNFVGNKMADAKFIPGIKDFSVLTPNSTSYASRIHDLLFTLIGGVKDPEKRQEFRKLTNQYYSAQLSQGLKKRNNTDNSSLIDKYIRFLNTNGSNSIYTDFFSNEVHDDPQLKYHISRALSDPTISLLDQQLRSSYLAMKRNKNPAVRERFRETFDLFNRNIESYLRDAKQPEKAEGDLSELTKAFYGDKGYSALVNHDNLDIAYAGLIKAADESLFTDDIQSLELAAKLIFEKNKGNQIDYSNLTKSQLNELLEVLRNEGDNRLFKALEEQVIADSVPDDLADEVPLEKPEVQSVESVLSSDGPAELESLNQQPVEVEDASNTQPIIPNEQAETDPEVQIDKAVEHESEYVDLVDINLLQGDTIVGEPDFENLKQMYSEGKVDRNALKKYLDQQPLSRLEKLVRRK